MMQRLRTAALSLAFAILALGHTLPAIGQSLPSATMPFAPKAIAVEALKLPADAAATVIRLDPPDPAAVDGMKRANGRATTKRLQIGIDRPLTPAPAMDSAALEWLPAEGGHAARWSITSADAKAMRIGLTPTRTSPALEIRFIGTARPDTVYGPFTERELNAAGNGTYWSPILEGNTAVVELFLRGDAAPGDISISVGKVSHLVASPADPRAESLLKIGQSEACEVNFICRAATDPGLASAGKAVARMTFSDGTGTFLCTGTLLNSTAGQFVPYFYTADHCIDTQSSASTITTHWFYESTACGADALSPSYVQVPGGATLLYVNSSFDISFMRLNATPPSGAVFAGWDAAQLANGTPLTAIHHPAGDLKKVSLGTMGGYTVPTGRSETFIQSNWNSLATGVTEGGSSGSGIFTQSGGQYTFRGGLLGGPSSCTASPGDLFDWYSRFDVAYQAVSQYLAAAATTNYTALWYNAPAESEAGWGINVSQQGDIVFATLFTYDSGGNPLWLVMSRGERQGSGDTFSGPLYRTTGAPFNQPSFPAAPTQVGTMTIAFTSASSASLTYSVNGTAVSKNITKQVFSAPGAAACVPTSGSRASATNYTDLWWNSPANSESGWGINLTHQGNIIFATLFTYDTNGQGLWLVMSAGQKQADGSFSGTLYQTRGNGGFNAQPWPGVSVNAVGTMTLRFANGENGTLTYTVNGTTVVKAITREVFSTPLPFCS